MHFTKMSGIGNDYVYLEDIQDRIKTPDQLARILSERHFGIGSDGLIIIKPSDQADFFMRMYNADGSEGKMCGNGIRCFSKLVYDLGLTRHKRLTIETLSGLKQVTLFEENGEITGAEVDMGIPDFACAAIPMIHSGETFIEQPLTIAGTTMTLTALSMGNPHLVHFGDDPSSLDLETIGPLFETDDHFPERVNTEFIHVIDQHHLKMRVWERGSGETLACGTGACASAVAAIKTGRCLSPVTVHLLGGDLDIQWLENGHVLMRGPATLTFSGEFNLENESDYYG